MLKNRVSEYLESKKLAWAPSTLKSEGARLAAVVGELDGDPERLWKFMEAKKLKPYARLTTFIRVINYWDFLIEMGETRGNPYRTFKRKNARLFKNVYQTKKPELTYEEAKARIEKIKEPSCRRRALELLGSGMRWTESQTHSGGFVIGKGGKHRAVYIPEVEGPAFNATYQTFRRCLQEVGLKPHDLRKLFLTKLVEMGANEFELMEAAGWSTLAPAKSYINVNKEKLLARIKGLHRK